MQQVYLDRLVHIEKLAEASRWKRLFYRPFRYVTALLWQHLIYRFSQKGKVKNADTFFDTSMQLLLPAGMDIYLLGAKTHDSEIRLSRWLSINLEQGDCFIDVGAHFGFFSLLASKLVGEEGHIFSFEAAPNTFQFLKKNTKQHENIQIFHRAVSDEKGSLTFHEFPIQYSEYNTLHPEQFEGQNWFKNKPSKIVEVEAVILGIFFNENKIKPNVIKIDVEGAEQKVVRGMMEYLKIHEVLLIIECTLLSLDSHIQLQKELQSIGYSPFVIGKKGDLLPIEHIKDYLYKKRLESDNFVFKKL